MDRDNKNVIRLSPPSKAAPKLYERERVATPEGRQLSLPIMNEKDVGFAATDDLNKARFMTILAEYQPTYLIDMRYVPQFDFGTEGGSEVFEIVERRMDYFPCAFPFHQLAGPVGLGDLEDTVKGAVNLIKHGRRGFRGPILVLVNSQRHARIVAPLFLNIIESTTDQAWTKTLY